jgi:hypothetical protein
MDILDDDERTPERNPVGNPDDHPPDPADDGARVDDAAADDPAGPGDSPDRGPRAQTSRGRR